MEAAIASARESRALRLGLVLAVALLAALAHRFGILQLFVDPSGIANLMRGLGGWGYVVFLVSYTALQPFGMPGTLFCMAAPLIWPWPVAFGLSMTGTMAASVVGFWFARFVARDWLERRLPARFHKYDDALAARAFTTIVILRFIFWMPQMLHTFFGLSKVSFWTHFWGSLVGYAVPLFLLSYFGQKLFDLMQATPPAVWFGLALGTGLVVLTVWGIRRRRSAA
ncbi:MAG TPA: VTT domain-containing protein [Polyangiaceae bacterium]|nr:VTT domain-containing protein [Polyangiaceae bacterium]